jgi:cytochrome c peroxidase
MTKPTASSSTSAGRVWMRWIGRILLVLVLFLCAAITALAYLPVPEDTPIPLALQGGGARQTDESTTGLQLVFPEIEAVDTQQAELGRLLFYDPTLSANNDLSCASCHHPDLGFSDGRQVALGSHDDLRRNAPTLWNVAYATTLFWDARADSLEAQMLEPLTAENEMGADLDELVAELQLIPEYETLFDAAYDDDITPDNIIAAIVEFERTLIANDSPFDRFAEGDFNALTPQQRRGFDLFRSANMRCFECHAWPTFTHETTHILGVPDLDSENPDLGVIEVRNSAAGERGFDTPTLRNVALSAPYMHNGVFATLEEVIQFYADGGGDGRGVEADVDEKVRGFDISDQQIADLVAFLHALTNEPTELITIPESVPSGLPVVEPIENPARNAVENSTAAPYNPATREAQTITVQAGESIQAGVDRALPGDTILVEPGIYYESVYIDTPSITVRGLVDGDNRPIMDGENVRSDGFNTTGDDFVLEGFHLRGYIGNAVLTTGAERVVYRDLIIEGTYGDTELRTIYGLYPVECTDVLIENTSVTGIADAGIYVGQSRGPIIVRDNEVFGNVTGIEIENSTYAEVYDNHVYNNTGGILVFLLPNNPSKVGYNTRVYNNIVEDNNHVNFGDPESTVSKVPQGTGIFIMTADNTEVFNNTIRNNQSMGLGLTSVTMLYDEDTEFDLGPIPENNIIHSNTWENNGYEPAGLVAELGLPGADIIWTGQGWNNSFEEPDATKFPPILPTRDMPTPVRRLLWRVYDIVIGILL